MAGLSRTRVGLPPVRSSSATRCRVAPQADPSVREYSCCPIDPFRAASRSLQRKNCKLQTREAEGTARRHLPLKPPKVRGLRLHFPRGAALRVTLTQSRTAASEVRIRRHDN